MDASYYKYALYDKLPSPLATVENWHLHRTMEEHKQECFNLKEISFLLKRMTSSEQKELLWKPACEQAEVLLLNTEEAHQVALLLEQSAKQLERFKVKMSSCDYQALFMKDYVTKMYNPAKCLDDADKVTETLLRLDGSKEINGLLIQLCNLQMNLYTSVEMALQRLQAICDYYYLLSKAVNWYTQVLLHIPFKDALLDEMPVKENDGLVYTSLYWRRQCHTVLQMLPQNPDEWIQLTKLSDQFKKEQGAQLSSRCLLLWKMLSTTGQIHLSDYQQVVSWQQNLPTATMPTRAGSLMEKFNAIPEYLNTEENIGLTTACSVLKDTVPTKANLSKSVSPHFDCNRSKLLAMFAEKIDLSCDGKALLASNTINPLCLPLVDFANSSKQSVISKTNDAIREICSLAQVKELAAQSSLIDFCAQDRLNTQSMEIQLSSVDKNAIAYHECGVQTDNPASESSDLYSRKYTLQNDTFNSTTAQEVDTKQSIMWDSYDLHLSRRLMGGNHSNHSRSTSSIIDWDEQEQDDLFTIEKLLKDAEAILKQEEVALGEEMELDDLILCEDLNATYCDLGPKLHEGKNCQDKSNDVMHNGNVRKKRLSSTPNVKCPDTRWHTRHEDSDLSFTGSICSPEDSILRAQSGYPNLFRELKEIYAIEDRICEENRKIEEFRDLEHIETVQEQESVFKISREKLLFLAQLQRERNEVDKLEKDLAKEAKKHKCLKKSEATKSKKYRQLLAKENTRLASEPTCQRASEAKSMAFSMNLPLAEGGCSILTHKKQFSPEKEALSGMEALLSASHSLHFGRSEDKRIVEGSEMTATQTKNVLFAKSLSTTNNPNFIKSASDVLQIAGNTAENDSLNKIPTLESVTNDDSPKQGVCTYSSYIGLSRPSPSEVLKSELVPVLHLNEVCSQIRQIENQKNLTCALRTNGRDAASCKADCGFKPFRNSCTFTPDSEPVSTGYGLSCFNLLHEQTRMAVHSNVSVPHIKTYPSSVLHSSTMKPTDYNSPIILDIGSGLMKAGFCNQDLPNTVFPIVIGRPNLKDQKINRTFKIFIGHEAQHTKSILSLTQPFHRGIVTDWKDLEKIWHYTFFNQLQINPQEHPVMLTDHIMSPCKSRARMVEIMFETFEVPFVYIILQAVLELYSTGRTTGVVFHSGDTMSYNVPVCETYILRHAVQKLSLAGRHLTSYLSKLLIEKGVLKTVEKEVICNIKEKLCYVAADPASEPPSEVHYSLPDGRTVTLESERYRACEVLFRPQLLGEDRYGIHESLLRSLLLSDMDLRKSFAQNIVVSGGNTLFPGFTSRLQSEISSMVPLELSDLVNVSRVPDDDFAVWCGGAAMTNLPSFHTTWISKQEYQEFGSEIVHRRCF